MRLESEPNVQKRRLFRGFEKVWGDAILFKLLAISRVVSTASRPNCLDSLDKRAEKGAERP